jgi:hypothetical protein
VVRAEHAVAAVAEVSAAEEQHLAALFVGVLVEAQRGDVADRRIELDEGEVERFRVGDDPRDAHATAADRHQVLGRDVARRVRCGQHPAVGDERARAVAAEEGHDGGPRGLSDDAVAIGAVVTQEHE